MNQQTKLAWIEKALEYLGLKENTSKTAHNQTILDMLTAMGSFNGEARAWWQEDETPWCGLFVGYCLGVVGRYVIKEWYRARAWESTLLTKLNKPAYGCIVTFTRDGGGHVGFLMGLDNKGNLMILGGNQSNAVSIVPFAKERATGFYWPSMWQNGKPVKSVPFELRYKLPVLNSNGKLSTNEQ